MKNIVITGSTRGIGYGLADSFLALGCSLTISGRTSEAVEPAVEALRLKHEADRLLGCPCDVRDSEALQALWDKAKAQFGKIDIWINNAGISNTRMKTWELSPDEIESVIETNLLGVMYGSRVAMRGMLEQGFGSLYNMEGMGSDGRRHDGLTLYGCSKYALRYFNLSLVEETKGTPIVVGALSPGMVMTDFLKSGLDELTEEGQRTMRIFNLLADRTETVTPWMAQKILANEKHGARISWLTRRKVMGRFLSARFRKRDLFD